MKRIITNIGIGIGVFLSLTACKNDDFLDRYPPDAFTEPTYFKTDSELRIFANIYYELLPQSILFSNDNNSDNMVPRAMDIFLSGFYTLPATGGGWSHSDWNTIRNCNFFLENYHRAEGINKERYAGEMRFFRALFYWEKVVKFGDVPLIIKKVDDTSPEIYGPRESRKKVMSQVLDDLDFAIANLPEKEDAESGRLHKDAALALKSRIALWEGTFRKYHGLGDEQEMLEAAVDASEKLMSSGVYSIYSTGNPQSDYKDLFVQENLSSNSEAIMHRSYVRGLNTHNYGRISGRNSNGCSKDFVESYLFTDGKPIGTTSFTYDDTHPAKEVLNRDPRYAQTIATPGYVKTRSETGLFPDVVMTLPSIGTIETNTGYWFIKGRSSNSSQQEAFNGDIDPFIFRYAEVLLNYAEAKYELGTLTQVDLDKSINKIRDRVAMPHLTMSAEADPNAVDYGYTVAPLLYEIRRERRVELVGEGFRFNDILRWKAGNLITNLKTIKGIKVNDALKAEYNSLVVYYLSYDSEGYLAPYTIFPTGRTWDDKMYLYPIPTDQLVLAGYQQNPGW